MDETAVLLAADRGITVGSAEAGEGVTGRRQRGVRAPAPAVVRCA
ncbi:hypothetical protein [Streptomyces sp. NPDC001450]